MGHRTPSGSTTYPSPINPTYYSVKVLLLGKMRIRITFEKLLMLIDKEHVADSGIMNDPPKFLPCFDTGPLYCIGIILQRSLSYMWTISDFV